MSQSLALALLLLGGKTHATPPPQPVKWEHRFDEAMKKARAAKKPVMVDFWADWCAWCHRLDQTTYVDPVVVKMSADFVPVKVDTEGSHKNREIALRYNVSTLPTIAFISPGGRQIMRLNGFQGPGQFPRTMETARETAARVMAWETALERDAKDPTALYSLGVHLFEQEYYEDSRELLYRASVADHTRPVKERKHTRMLIGIIQNYGRKFPEGESALKDALSMRPATEYDPKMLYILARMYQTWGRKDHACATARTLLAEYPDTTVAHKAKDVVSSSCR